jgi:hypothetical protein
VDISKYCKGLPGILGLKERGRGLPVLGDALAATFESRDLYLLDTREAQGFGPVVAPIGLTKFVGAIPVGELWYVWNFDLFGIFGAGVAVDVAPACNIDGVMPMMTGIYDSFPANSTWHSRSSGPFWAGAGSEFGFFVRTVTGAPTIGALLVVTKIKV